MAKSIQTDAMEIVSDIIERAKRLDEFAEKMTNKELTNHLETFVAPTIKIFSLTSSVLNESIRRLRTLE